MYHFMTTGLTILNHICECETKDIFDTNLHYFVLVTLNYSVP